VTPHVPTLDDAVRTLRDRLTERAFEPTLTIKRLSCEVWFNARYVQECFSITYGESPWRYVERLRVELACRLLREPGRIRDVGEIVGYRSTATFNAAFRRRLGVNPSAYRRLVRAGASEELLAGLLDARH